MFNRIWLNLQWRNPTCYLSYSDNEYHACWCSGDFRSLGISRHGIEPPKPEYSIASIRRVNQLFKRYQFWHHFQVVNFFRKLTTWKCSLFWWIRFLTLDVRGPSFLGLTRSISWLLMPWLLTSPGHQQPWFWLCRICRSFSYLRKCFKYLCQINVEEWHKMQINVYVTSEKFSM